MITFVPCNIFERIWYSEFILDKSNLYIRILLFDIEEWEIS